METTWIFIVLLVTSVFDGYGQHLAAPSVNFIITKPAINRTANDVAIDEALKKMSNGEFSKDDNYLIGLIKKGVRDAVLASGEFTNPTAFLQAGSRKAQVLVSDVTAAYTRAIFRAKSAIEARKILSRYRETIKTIVDFTKEGKFGL